MKLYSGPVSLFTAKVRVALAEKALDYERVDVGWSLASRYLPHHPDVAALNPKREVPVLADGDLVLYDSTVILEYLEDRYPEPALFPNDPVERAQCRLLEAAADEIVFPFVWDLVEESLYPAPADGRDRARLESAKSGLFDQCKALDERLGDREFLLSDFSVADIGTFIMLASAASLGAPIAERFGALLGWFARLSARETLATELREMQRFLATELASASP